jgi:hypothetical protein
MLADNQRVFALLYDKTFEHLIFLSLNLFLEINLLFGLEILAIVHQAFSCSPFVSLKSIVSVSSWVKD